jgi:uncharacterized protein (TIGR03437 family)
VNALTVIRAAMAVFAAVASARCAELSVPASTAAPGTRILLPVSFSSQSSSVTAIQFDLQFDSTVLSLCATAGEGARISKKTLYLWDLAAGQRRFLIVGRNSDTVSDGALVNLVASLSSSAPGGVYPLRLLNVVATDPSAEAVTVNAVSGAITVPGNPSEVTLLFGDGAGPALSPSPRACPTFSSPDVANVLFDGIPAPLLYAAPNQGGAVDPYVIQHTWSQSEAHLPLSVAETAPSIFTLDGSGVGPGAILNEDYSVNSPSNPAEKGTVIRLFAKAGRTDVPGIDGQITGLPMPTVSVQIGGLVAEVLYAGAAPGLVDGVMQVSCMVPLDAPSGSAVPVMLYAGKTRSPAGVTLTIH